MFKTTIGAALSAFFCLLLTAPAQAYLQDVGGTVFEMPTDWDTLYVVLLSEGPDYNDNSEPDKTQAIMYQHIQYQLGLQDSGEALAGGGFSEASDGMIGLTLLRANSLEDAQRIANQDPAVLAGRFKATVKAWYVPDGRL